MTYFMHKKLSLGRYLLSQRKHPLIARLLDALEEDYRRIYPGDDPPFEKGFDESIRKLIRGI